VAALATASAVWLRTHARSCSHTGRCGTGTGREVADNVNPKEVELLRPDRVLRRRERRPNAATRRRRRRAREGHD
jgi:hypothetical protein